MQLTCGAFNTILTLGSLSWAYDPHGPQGPTLRKAAALGLLLCCCCHHKRVLLTFEQGIFLSTGPRRLYNQFYLHHNSVWWALLISGKQNVQSGLSKSPNIRKWKSGDLKSGPCYQHQIIALLFQ